MVYQIKGTLLLPADTCYSPVAQRKHQVLTYAEYATKSHHQRLVHTLTEQ